MAPGPDPAAWHADAAFLGLCIDRRLARLTLTERQMHALRCDFLVLGQSEELLQDIFRAAGARAEHPEVIAATADLHVETRLEQTEILIERATEVGQPRVVRRLEIEFAQRLG